MKMRKDQDQYDRYAHISRRLSLNSDADDPVVAERCALWQNPSNITNKQIDEQSSDEEKSSPTTGVNFYPQDFHLHNFDDENEEVHGYTNFHRLCILPQKGPSDPRWDGVRQYLSQLSGEDVAILTSTQKGDKTPLHVCCFLSPPIDVVQKIIQLCPESVRMTTDHGDTALGLACAGFVPACDDVIEALVKALPSARNCLNSRYETPLHLHLKMSRSYDVDPSPSVVRLLTTVDAVNTQDKRGYTPLCILGKAASEALSAFSSCIRFFTTPDQFSSDVDNGPNIDNYRKCLQFLLEHDPSRASKTQFLRDLLHFPKSLLHVSFEKEHTRQVLNDICGRGPYIAMLMTDFYIQLMIVLSYTLGCKFGFQGNGTTTAMLAGCAYWTVRRFASAIGSNGNMKEFQVMNLLQVLTLMPASIYLRNNGVDLLYEEGVNGTWRNVLILAAGLIWLNLMGIVCHAMKGFSVFVNATAQIFKQLINLFVVFIVIFCSFATMLYISSVGSPGYCTPEDDLQGSYCTLNETMRKIGSIFFGALDPDDFDLPQPTLVLFIFYNLFVIILLLNIIIAVMSDSYVEVNQTAELIFWNHRFDLIHDVDAFVNFFTVFVVKKKEGNQIAEQKQLIKTDWFVRVVHQRSQKTLPKPFMDLLLGIIMMFWVLAGLCTVGLVWPRHIRRKIFAPPTADHMKTNNAAEVDKVAEKMKEEYSLLRKENAELIEQIKKLQNALLGDENGTGGNAEERKMEEDGGKEKQKEVVEEETVEKGLLSRLWYGSE